jgi:PKD repeat protein
MKKFLLSLGVSVIACFGYSQSNIAPQATAGASTCNTGPCSTLNDLNLGNCGSQEMWISTSSPPSSTPGVDWLRFDWPSVRVFDEFIIHHAEDNSRFLTGGLIQYWDGSNWVNHTTFSNLPMQCINSVTFPAIVSDRVRITAFQMTGSGQTSNPNFREIEVIEAIPDDAGVTMIDTPNVPDCLNDKLVIRLNNLGSDTLYNASIDWSVNGVQQNTVLWSGQVEEAGGISDPVFIGNYNWNMGDTIKVWTSMPNGQPDLLSDNDTLIHVIPTYDEIDLNTNIVLCEGSEETIDTEVYFGDHQWSNGKTSRFINIQTAGIYDVTVEDVATGCVQEETFFVTEEAVVNLPDTTVIGCVEDGGAVLSGNVPGSYNWNTGASTSFLNVTQSGMYSVSVTEPTGKCISSDSVQVDILDSPVANFGQNVSYTTVSFTDSSEFATSYFWDFGDGNTSTGSNPVHVYDFPGGTFDITMVVSNNCGTDTLTKSVTADETTGVNDLNGEDEVAVYPNPTSGIFSINSSNLNSHISEIYDVTGKLARTIRWKSKVNVNVSDLNGGIYIVKTYDDEGIVDVTKLSVTK